jgi:flagellar hook-length control protein FliK
MTAPLAPAAAAPAPAAASPAATDAPGGAERFASALDDAVSRGQDGPRGREPAAETDGAPAEPALEAPDGEQSATEQPVAGQPAVSPAGMPPGLWALLTGIGPGAATPVAPGTTPVVAATGDLAPAVGASTPTALTAAARVTAPGAGPVAPAAVDVLPPAVASAAAVSGAVPVPVPVPVDAVGPGTPAAATTGMAAPAAPAPATTAAGTPDADPLPGFTVVVAAPEIRAVPVPAGVPDAAPPATFAAVAAPAPTEGTGTDTGAAPDQEAPAPAPTPAAAPTAAVAAPAVPAATPVPTAEPAAPATPAPPVAGQVAQQVAVLRHGPDGTHTMTLVLTPETLGPVEVQVTLSQGSVDLALRSATEAGRAALLDALPDLRRDLAGAGLTCTNASVDRDSGASWASAQQHAAGDRAGQQGQPDGRGRPWLHGTEADPGRPAPGSTATPSSGVDVRV